MEKVKQTGKEIEDIETIVEEPTEEQVTEEQLTPTEAEVMEQAMAEILEQQQQQLQLPEEATDEASEESVSDDEVEDDTGFFYYPDLEDPLFDQKIFRKKEFHDTRIKAGALDLLKSDKQQEHQAYLKKRCDPNYFKLQNYQIFVRNYLSPGTPYNGLLLFHGVGTGKTCAAIQIAEGFKEDVVKRGRKITVVASDVLQKNFQQNLYNFKKDDQPGLVGGVNQCTGRTYYLPTEEFQDVNARQKQIKLLQEQYYQYTTYYTFHSQFDQHLEEYGITKDELEAMKRGEEPAAKLVNMIRQVYDHTLYIVDEAHRLLEQGKSKGGGTKGAKGKKKSIDDELDAPEETPDEEGDQSNVMIDAGTMTPQQEEAAKKQRERVFAEKTYGLMMDVILPYCQNIKILLLTATPMRNEPEDLVKLVNILRMNDYKDRDELIKSDKLVMIPNYKQDLDNPIDPSKVYNAKYLQEMIRGYVSYVRGENPLTFARKYYYSELPQAQTEIGLTSDSPNTYLARPLFDYYQSPIRLYQAYLQEDTIRSQLYNANQIASTPIEKDLMPPQKIAHIVCEMSVFQYYHYLRLESSTGLGTTTRRVGMQAKSGRVGIGGNVPELLTRVGLFVFPDAKAMSKGGDKALDKVGEGFWNTRPGHPGDAEIYPVLASLKNQYTGAFARSGSEKRWKYQDEARLGDILDQKHLSYYSAKFARLLKFLIDPSKKGIHYIYTKYRPSSAFIIAMILEENGFQYFQREKDPFLQIKSSRKRPSRCYCGRLESEHRANPDLDHEFRQGSFILYTSSFVPSPEILAKINSRSNQNGKIVKFIIGTNTASEGIDYKRLRHMHLMDPWHNATVADQTIGRALRHCAHADLPTKDQQVVIYQYSVSPPIYNHWTQILKDPYWSGKYLELWNRFNELVNAGKLTQRLETLDYLPMRETNDERMYRRAFFKDRHIKYIERIVKSAAVDCNFNYHYNVGFPGDRPGSRELEYQQEPYECAFPPPSMDGFEVNTDTFKHFKYFSQPILDEIVNNLGDLFRNNFAMDLPTLEQLIYGKYQYDFSLNKELQRRYLYLALDRILGKSEPGQQPLEVYDKYQRKGYIIYRPPYYVFQPESLMDTRLPLYYRVAEPEAPKEPRIKLALDRRTAQKKQAVTYQDFHQLLMKWNKLFEEDRSKHTRQLTARFYGILDRYPTDDQRALAELAVQVWNERPKYPYRMLVRVIIDHYIEWLLLLELKLKDGNIVYLHTFDPTGLVWSYQGKPQPSKAQIEAKKAEDAKESEKANANANAKTPATGKGAVTPKPGRLPRPRLSLLTPSAELTSPELFTANQQFKQWTAGVIAPDGKVWVLGRVMGHYPELKQEFQKQVGKHPVYLKYMSGVILPEPKVIFGYLAGTQKIIFKIVDRTQQQRGARTLKKDDPAQINKKYSISGENCETMNLEEYHRKYVDSLYQQLGKMGVNVQVTDRGEHPHLDQYKRSDQCNVIEEKLRQLTRLSNDTFYFLNLFYAPISKKMTVPGSKSRKPKETLTDKTASEKIKEKIAGNPFVKAFKAL